MYNDESIGVKLNAWLSRIVVNKNDFNIHSSRVSYGATKYGVKQTEENICAILPIGDSDIYQVSITKTTNSD